MKKRLVTDWYCWPVQGAFLISDIEYTRFYTIAQDRKIDRNQKNDSSYDTLVVAFCQTFSPYIAAVGSQTLIALYPHLTYGNRGVRQIAP
jgi:hypothetical protein